MLLTPALLATTSLTEAASRHALVIGNSDYEASPLINPVNDARDMASVLSGLSFEVFGGRAHTDLTFEQMDDLINDFAGSLPPAAVALFYFAGHGTNDDNRHNYLIPLDAGIRRESQIKHRAMSLGYIADTLKDGNHSGLNILLIDACRDRPFGSGFTRSGSRGMARPARVPVGTFIGLAAGEGQVAEDGLEQSNGVYTGRLIEALRTYSDLPIEQLHKRVGQAVYQQTIASDDPQRPMYQSNFYGDWCFDRCRTEGNSRDELQTDRSADGSFAVAVNPASARICFYHEENWHCDRTARLPLGRSYPVYVSAEGYDDYRVSARLDHDKTLLEIDMQPVKASPATAQPMNSGLVNEKSLYKYAYDQLVRGRNDEAMAGFETQLREYPRGVYADRAYYWLGEANYAEHRFAAAIHHFSVVIEQFPDSEKAPDARLRRAYALIDSHQFQRARQELEVVRVLYGGRSVATLASLRINQLDHAGR